MLVMSVLLLMIYYYERIDIYVTHAKYLYGPIWGPYLNKVKIFLKALGKSFITLFFASFFPLIMIVYGGDVGNLLLVIIGWLVFGVLFYLIGCWKYVGLWKTWREVFSRRGRGK